MSKPNIRDFFRWALPYANVDKIAPTAKLVIPLAECGQHIAHYLLGTIWMLTTPDNIYAIWQKQYASRYTWDCFKDFTKDWLPSEHATDCQGLCDAFFRFIWEGGDHKTDYSANGNYEGCCGEKGEIANYKALPLGAAVFKRSYNSKTKQYYMSHIGYICGFDGDEPLVLEAQGLSYGVKVNYLKDRREFTYYGIMSKLFDYKEESDMVYPETPVVFELTSPMMRGDDVRLLQQTMNLLGYKDNEGELLTEDGKCGKKTMQALTAFVYEHQFLINPTVIPPVEPEPVTHTLKLSVDGDTIFEGVV